MTFIDDHSRKTWIYFLGNKKSEEVLQRFQEFKALMENQVGGGFRHSYQIKRVSIPPRSSMSIANKRTYGDS